MSCAESKSRLNTKANAKAHFEGINVDKVDEYQEQFQRKYVEEKTKYNLLLCVHCQWHMGGTSTSWCMNEIRFNFTFVKNFQMLKRATQNM